MLGALFQAFAGQLAPPPYQGKYRAFPVLHAPGAGKAQLEEGDKILLPQSAFDALARLRVTYPMLFEITNPMVPALRTHCGVMEFSAEEGVAYLPLWMMDGLALEPGSLITVSNVALQKGTFVKLQPHLTSFTRLSNPRVVLEKALRKFSCLTKGNTIRIHYGDQKFDLDVVEVKPAGAVSIIETDMQVDFAPPKDYKEDTKTSSASSGSTSAPSVPGGSAFAMRNNDDDTKQQIAFEKAAAAVLAADVEGTSSWASAAPATAAAAAAANGGTPGKGDPSYFSKLSGGQSLSGRKKKTGTTPLVGPIAGSPASIPPLTASPARPTTGAGVTPPPIAVTPNLKRPHSSNVTPSPTLSRAGSTTGTASSSNGGYVTVTKPGHSSNTSSGSESPVKKAPALIRSSSDGSGATTTGSSRPNSAAAARWAAYTPNGNGTATESKLTTTPTQSGSIGGPVKRAPNQSASPAPSPSSTMPPPSSPALTARAASGSSLASLAAAPIAVETTVTTVGNFDYIYEKGPNDATPRLVKRVSSKSGATAAAAATGTTATSAPPAFVPFGGSGNKLK